MKKAVKSPLIIDSISEQHRLYSLPKPEHPLVSLISFVDIGRNPNEFTGAFAFNFYASPLKKVLKGNSDMGRIIMILTKA